MFELLPRRETPEDNEDDIASNMATGWEKPPAQLQTHLYHTHTGIKIALDMVMIGRIDTNQSISKTR
jgi:hypothetical protein